MELGFSFINIDLKHILLTDFRERVENEFPELTEYYNTISGMYLKVMPKRLRDKILDVKDDGNPTSATSPSQTTVENVSNVTNPTNPSAITAAAAAMATTITQTQSNLTPKK